MHPKKKISSSSSRTIQSETLQSHLIVLHTKMCRPAVAKNTVIRQSIIDRLEAHLLLPLTLISANTGCGKSTIASQWLDQTNHKSGWLSIDEEHNHAEVLLAYFLAILKENWPDKSFSLELLKNNVQLSPSLIASSLISDLDELEEPFILVLDDYHLIKNERIHEIINEVLRYPSEKFHLVILTQIDPPLKLARLRAQFRMHELRMTDLVFTTDEALKLRSIISRDTTDDQVQSLVNFTEGWVTGVTAGLMGLARGVSYGKVANALHDGGSIISGLLDEVVINGLPAKSVKFLELTAALDRFSADLIRTMAESIGDQDFLPSEVEELLRNSQQRNLFLIPLDTIGEWYRYHHFFRSQIRQRSHKYFQNTEVEKLYKVASGWFEERGLFEEALTYALRSRDIDFAIGLFSGFRRKLINREQYQRLDILIHQFPEDVRNNHLELLISLAILQDYKANFIGMQQYLSRAEEILKEFTDVDDQRKQLIGEYHGISTLLSFILSDFNKAIDHGRKCMELLPAGEPNFIRELGVGWYAFAQQACGHARVGIDRIKNEYQSLANTHPYFQMRLLQGKLIFDLFEGSTAHLYDDGSSLANICSPENYPGSWMIGIYGMACHLYLNNHVEKVSGFHDSLRLHRYSGRPFWVMHHFFLECLSAMARGMWQKAEHYIAECEEMAEELAIEPLKGMVKAIQVEYYLRVRNVDLAKEVSAMANFEPHPPVFFYFIPQLTQVKLFVHTNREERAYALLRELLETGRAKHNKNLLIQALALQAVIHAEKEDTYLAVNSLQELLVLTKSSGNIRTFLDHGSTMEKLLRRIENNASDEAQVRMLLQAFDQEKHVAHQGNVSRKRFARSIEIDLSRRESEILALVTQGFKNDEIAQKLFISLDTVKKHLYNAFQKLEVKNRVTAIRKVKELGILDR